MDAVNAPPHTGEETNTVIGEMLDLSSALVTCIKEHNDVLFDLQERTIDFFEKVWRLIEKLTRNPVLVSRESEALLAALHEEQRRVMQAATTRRTQGESGGVFVHAAPERGQLQSGNIFYHPESDSLPGHARAHALNRLYEDTVRNITKTMGQTVQNQGSLGDLRTQTMVSTNEVLTTVLHILALSPVEMIDATRRQQGE